MMAIANVGYLLHLFRRQFEGQRSQVVAEPLLLGAGGDRHDALVNDPSQKYLAWVDGILLGQ